MNTHPEGVMRSLMLLLELLDLRAGLGRRVSEQVYCRWGSQRFYNPIGQNRRIKISSQEQTCILDAIRIVRSRHLTGMSQRSVLGSCLGKQIA
jgi:hypothetical protein